VEMQKQQRKLAVDEPPNTPETQHHQQQQDQGPQEKETQEQLNHQGEKQAKSNATSELTEDVDLSAHATPVSSIQNTQLIRSSAAETGACSSKVADRYQAPTSVYDVFHANFLIVHIMSAGLYSSGLVVALVLGCCSSSSAYCSCCTCSL
jgi:hypothetical protein